MNLGKTFLSKAYCSALRTLSYFENCNSTKNQIELKFFAHTDHFGMVLFQIVCKLKQISCSNWYVIYSNIFRCSSQLTNRNKFDHSNFIVFKIVVSKTKAFHFNSTEKGCFAFLYINHFSGSKHMFFQISQHYMFLPSIV